MYELLIGPQRRPDQPGVHLLLPGHVPRVREGCRESREGAAEDQAPIPLGAQVRRREEADVLPPGARGCHRGSGDLHLLQTF